MRILPRKAYRFTNGVFKKDRMGNVIEEAVQCVPLQIMDVPDWVAQNTLFKNAVINKNIEILDGKQREQVEAAESGESDADAPNSNYKGLSKKDVVTELKNRGLNFDLNAKKTVLEEILIADDKKK